jgi:hypothetical protein
MDFFPNSERFLTGAWSIDAGNYVVQEMKLTP